jgi:hypothetical protein
MLRCFHKLFDDSFEVELEISFITVCPVWHDVWAVAADFQHSRHFQCLGN